MKTNIYMMLNDIESNADDYPQENWTEADAKKMKKKVFHKLHNRGRKKSIIAFVCTAAVLALVIMLPFSGTAADAMEQLTYRIGTFLGIDKNLSPYEQIVNQSITDHGITMTLNSVVLDENELTVSTTETYEDSSEAMKGSITGNVYVNGVSASDGAGGGSRSIDEHTTETVMTYHLDHIDTSRNLDIIIRFRGYEAVRGSWEFKFNADGKQLLIDTATVHLKHQYQLPDGSTITLTRYTSNAMGQKIYYTTDGNKNDYDMILKGTDDLGNAVSFYVSSSDKKGGKFVIDNLDGNLNDDATALTLTPYAVKMPETSGKMSDDYQPAGESFTFELK